MVEHLFSGSGVCVVDGAGGLLLPAFVRETISRRSAAHRLLIGSHESDPCLVAYDPGFVSTIHADVERRRIAEQAVSPQLHFMRARRAFGFVESADVAAGRIVLPELMRRRAHIAQLALLVGTGGAFEIWDARIALEHGEADLHELAAFHIDRQQAA
jgi:MraZ protein